MGKKVLAPNIEAFFVVFGEKSDHIFHFNTKEDNQIFEIYDSIKNTIDGNLLESVNFFPNIREFVSNRYTWGKQAKKLFDFCKTL